MTSLIPIYFAAMLGMSAAGLLLMGLDKSFAKAHRRRIPEKALFAAAILLGGVGSCLGMFAFRHKTKHWYFRLFFPLLAAVQIVLGLALLLVQ